MTIDPAKARVLSVVLLVSGAALVLFGGYLWRSGSNVGLPVMAVGLADITIGISMRGRRRA